MIKWLISGGVALLAAALLFDAPAVSAGIKRGLNVSAGVLIPSLFPFMVLCGFISTTDFGRVLALPFGWICEKLYKLPRDLGAVILLSMIGGYPVGARMISELLAQGRIDRKTAERMLCFCVNAGPSFMITAVGAGMFLSRKAGVILFLVQVTATFIVGLIVSARVKAPDGTVRKAAPMQAAPAFVLAVTGASTSMIAMCAFAVFFSGVLEMITQSGIAGMLAGAGGLNEQTITAVINGFFEVTSGCRAAARVGGPAGFAMAAVFISFSGVSVIFQVISFFRDNMIRMVPLLWSRVLHMMITGCLSFFLYRKFCGAEKVWAALPAPEMLVSGRTAMITICLIGMSTILALSMGGKNATRGKY